MLTLEARRTRYITFLINSIYTNGYDLTLQLIETIEDEEKRAEHLDYLDKARHIVQFSESI